MNTIKFCLHCGHAISAEEKFCSGCGANVAEMESTQNNSAPASAPVAPTQNVQPSAVENPQAQGNVPPVQQPYNAEPNMAYTAPVAAAKKPNPIAPIIEKVKAKPMIAIIPAAILVLLIVAIIILCNIFKYQTIDAKDLYRIEFNGVNSAGVCTAELSKYDDYIYELKSSKYSDALNAFADELGIETDSKDSDSEKEPDVSPYFTVYEDNLTEAFSKAGDFSEAKSMRSALLNSKAKLKIKISKEKGLSNGDTVKFTVTYNEEYLKNHDIKLKNTEFEVKADDLEDGEKIDLFDGVEVTFEGNDGEGSANVNTNGAKYSNFVGYDYDYVSNLTNGGKYTVKAEIYTSYNKISDDSDAVWFEYDGKYYTCDNYTATKEYDITGLKELTEIDAFENLKVTYANASPFISIEIDNSDCSSQVKEYVNFYCEDADLKIGDTFTVKAYAYGLSDYGYKLKGTPDEDGYYTKEYTVEDTAPVYANEDNVAQIIEGKKGDVSAQFSKIKSENKGSSYFQGLDFDGSIESFGDFKAEKTYLITTTAERKDNIGYSEYVNLVGSVYTSSIKTDEKSTATFAMVMFYGNTYIDNGKVMSNDEPEIRYFEKLSDAEEFIKGLATDYNVQEISASAETITTTAAADNGETTTTTKAAATTTKKDSETTLVP